MFAALRDV